MLVGYILLYCVNVMRKRQLGKKKSGGIRSFGLLRFFRNAPALVFDVLLIVGLFGFVGFCFFNKGSYGSFVFLFLSVLSLQYHAIFNGVNYRFISQKGRYIRKSENNKLKKSRGIE